MLTSLSILCPVDFSDRSRHALRWAANVLEHRGGELTVLTVIEPLLAASAGIRLGISLAEQQTEHDLSVFLDETLHEWSRHRLHIRLEVKIGHASDAILQMGRERNIQLIVMGAHGRSGIRKFLLGSTAEEVLSRSDCPLLVVPEGAALHGDDLDGHLRKMLLATDFGQSAMAATQWAVDIASEMRVPLVLAHVVEAVVVSPEWQGLVDDLDSERLESGKRSLERLSTHFQDSGVVQVVSVGHPADTIAALAVEHAVDLVVMGLETAQPHDRHLTGSIAYRVMSTARVAVVVVPPVPNRDLGEAPGGRAPSPGNLTRTA